MTGSKTTEPAVTSASRASPAGASGDSSVASAMAPAAPARPTTSAPARPSTTKSLGRTPTADRDRWSARSLAACLATAWPSTASPASAASAASTHQPTACGLIEPCTAAASLSSPSVPSTCSERALASKAFRSAAPCLSRTKYTGSSGTRGFTVLANAAVGNRS